MYIQLKNFIQKYKWRTAPIVTAFVVGLIGYIFIHLYFPADLWICGEARTVDCMDAIGFPARSYGIWLFVASFLVFFSGEERAKRWIYFAFAYFLLIVFLVLDSSEYGLGGLVKEKVFIVDWGGIILILITAFWVISHRLLFRKK